LRSASHIILRQLTMLNARWIRKKGENAVMIALGADAAVGCSAALAHPANGGC